MRKIIKWLTNRNNIHSISILDSSWGVIKDDVNLLHIPRIDEYIWIEDLGLYFKVINVVSSIKDNLRQVLIITDPVELTKIEGSEEK